MSVEEDWSRAFARQAQADWRAYECLVQFGAEAAGSQSENLHLLQMAIEKLIKAHLYLEDNNPDRLQSKHDVIAKHLPNIFRTLYARRQSPDRKPDRRRTATLMVNVRKIAYKIAKLHPKNDGGICQFPNCEYPWKNPSGIILVPAEYSFVEFTITRENWWMDFVKIVKAEMARLASEA